MAKRVAAVAMHDRVGQRFTAVVTGVTPKGTFVRVLNPPVEGILCRGQEGADVGDKLEVTVADDGQRHPVLLARTPYGREFLRTLHDSVALAREGWAVVLQDVRGRFGSDGAFNPVLQESADGAAAVAWCAAQPWSTGRVAMPGGSYQGYAAWAAALQPGR